MEEIKLKNRYMNALHSVSECEKQTCSSHIPEIIQSMGYLIKNNGLPTDLGNSNDFILGFRRNRKLSVTDFLPFPFLIYKQYGVDAFNPWKNKKIVQDENTNISKIVYNYDALDFVNNLYSSQKSSPGNFKFLLAAYTQLMLCILEGFTKDKLIYETCGRYRGYVVRFSSSSISRACTPDSFFEEYYDKGKNWKDFSGRDIDIFNAALWCFMTTDSVEECIHRCKGFGEYSGDVADIASGIAGAYYNRYYKPIVVLNTNEVDVDKYMKRFLKLL